MSLLAVVEVAQPRMGSPASAVASAAAARLIASAEAGGCVDDADCGRRARGWRSVEAAAIQPTVPKCSSVPSADCVTMSPPRYAPKPAGDVLHRGSSR